MSWRPELTVAAVIERDARFLIVEEQISGRRVFNQPAGHVEPGEALLDAVIRETREETAWTFRPTVMIGLYLWRSSQRNVHTLRFAFTGDLLQHDPRQPLDHPVIATHWLAPAELRERSLALRTPMVMRCIDDYLSGQRLPLTALSDLGTEVAPGP